MGKRGEQADLVEDEEALSLSKREQDEEDQGHLTRTVSVIEASSTFETFSGPAPHPDLLESYDRVVPGAARELLDGVREERLHRYRGDEFERRLMKQFADAEIGNSRLGLIFGFVIGMTGLIVACVCALTDHETTAAIVAGVDLLALVTVFVTGRVFEAKRGEPQLPASEASVPEEPLSDSAEP